MEQELFYGKLQVLNSDDIFIKYVITRPFNFVNVSWQIPTLLGSESSLKIKLSQQKSAFKTTYFKINQLTIAPDIKHALHKLDVSYKTVLTNCSDVYSMLL